MGIMCNVCIFPDPLTLHLPVAAWLPSPAASLCENFQRHVVSSTRRCTKPLRTSPQQLISCYRWHSAPTHALFTTLLMTSSSSSSPSKMSFCKHHTITPTIAATTRKKHTQKIQQMHVRRFRFRCCRASQESLHTLSAWHREGAKGGRIPVLQVWPIYLLLIKMNGR
jgi:hypothetical protein